MARHLPEPLRLKAGRAGCDRSAWTLGPRLRVEAPDGDLGVWVALPAAATFGGSARIGRAGRLPVPRGR